VPLARLEAAPVPPASERRGPERPVPAQPGEAEPTPPPGPPERRGPQSRRARIVLYRRPLMARAEGEEELAELVLDVIVEQFARWLGVDPQTVDPGYPAEE
jgi:hypothetical protein